MPSFSVSLQLCASAKKWRLSFLFAVASIVGIARGRTGVPVRQSNDELGANELHPWNVRAVEAFRTADRRMERTDELLDGQYSRGWLQGKLVRVDGNVASSHLSLHSDGKFVTETGVPAIRQGFQDTTSDVAEDETPKEPTTSMEMPVVGELQTPMPVAEAETRGISKLLVIAAGVSVGMILIVIAAIGCICCSRRKKVRLLQQRSERTFKAGDDTFVPPVVDEELSLDGMGRRDSVPWGHPAEPLAESLNTLEESESRARSWHGLL